MIYVQHPTPVPPQLAAEYARNPAPPNPTEAWGQFGGKAEVVATLEPAQRGLCAYCEELLSTHGHHIDHIVPKSVNHSGTFQFTNLTLSCTDAAELGVIREGSSCGHFRGNTFDPVLFIKPTEPDCADYFSCKLNGELQPTIGLVDAKRVRAEYMIRELNLKCTRLNRRRRDWLHALLEQIADMASDRVAAKWFLQEALGPRKPFVSVVKEYFGRV